MSGLQEDLDELKQELNEKMSRRKFLALTTAQAAGIAVGAALVGGIGGYLAGLNQVKEKTITQKVTETLPQKTIASTLTTTQSVIQEKTIASTLTTTLEKTVTQKETVTTTVTTTPKYSELIRREVEKYQGIKIDDYDIGEIARRVSIATEFNQLKPDAVSLTVDLYIENIINKGVPVPSVKLWEIPPVYGKDYFGRYVSPTERLTIPKIIFGQKTIFPLEMYVSEPDGKEFLPQDFERLNNAQSDPWRWAIIQDPNGFWALPFMGSREDTPYDFRQIENPHGSGYTVYELFNNPSKIRELLALCNGQLFETSYRYRFSPSRLRNLLSTYDFFWQNIPREAYDDTYVTFITSTSTIGLLKGESWPLWDREDPITPAPIPGDWFSVITAEDQPGWPKERYWAGLGLKKFSSLYNEILREEPEVLFDGNYKLSGLPSSYVWRKKNWTENESGLGSTLFTKTYRAGGAPVITYFTVWEEGHVPRIHSGAIAKLRNKLIWSSNRVGGNSIYPYWIDIEETKKVNPGLKRIFVLNTAIEANPFLILYSEK